MAAVVLKFPTPHERNESEIDAGMRDWLIASGYDAETLDAAVPAVMLVARSIGLTFAGTGEELHAHFQRASTVWAANTLAAFALLHQHGIEFKPILHKSMLHEVR